MKLKDTFVTQEMDGEQVMVEADGGFAGMVRSNATAAFIIDQLKTETTKEAILDAMCKKYDAPRAVMAEDVDMVINNLKKSVRWMRKSTFEEEIAHNWLFALPQCRRQYAAADPAGQRPAAYRPQTARTAEQIRCAALPPRQRTICAPPYFESA